MTIKQFNLTKTLIFCALIFTSTIGFVLSAEGETETPPGETPPLEAPPSDQTMGAEGLPGDAEGAFPTETPEMPPLETQATLPEAAAGVEALGAAEPQPEAAVAEPLPMAQPAALPAEPQAPPQVPTSDVKVYFDDLEDSLLAGDYEQLKKVCEMNLGSGCGLAKNFLSTCTLFQKNETNYKNSACVQKGAERYQFNPENETYPAEPNKNREAMSVSQHLTGQLKGERANLTPDKAKFLRILCTKDALTMLEDREDLITMEEACLKFKFPGNPPPAAIAKLHAVPHSSKKRKKRGKIKPIIEDKESYVEEEPIMVPKKRKKAAKKARPMAAETTPEPTTAAPMEGEPMAPEAPSQPLAAEPTLPTPEQAPAAQGPYGINEGVQEGFGGDVGAAENVSPNASPTSAQANPLSGLAQQGLQQLSTQLQKTRGGREGVEMFQQFAGGLKAGQSPGQGLPQIPEQFQQFVPSGG
jgi:hypothetical protein